MLALGVGVLGEALYKSLHPAMPGVETMGLIGAIALGANLACFFLLYRHRADNLNMSSTWICSRNDLIANVGVLLAAAACYEASSQWPDIIVGCVIAALFLKSSFSVVHAALGELRKPLAAAPQLTTPVTIRFVNPRR